MPRIAIVGRGFSGAAAAAALLRSVRQPFSLVLIDDASTLGGGLAYGKARAGELLNVRARDLALLAEERGDFGVWLRGRLVGDTDAAPPADLEQIFAPRALFRDYSRERLLEEMLRRPDVPVQLVDGEATSLSQSDSGAFSIGFEKGGAVHADCAILATGYDNGCARRFGRDPFAPIGDDELSCAREIVLVGSGLTMVDALLRLRRQGCAARITIISRHGMLPLPQLARSPSPEPQLGVSPSSLRDLVREVRAASKSAEARGRSWQAVVNGLRPATQRLWLELSIAEQKRFLRHVRSYWDIHRHRLPADVYSQVTHEVARERTAFRAGRVISVDPASVSVRWRGAKTTETLAADIVLDCSGHKPNLAAPLLKSIFANHLASADAHSMGLKVEPNGRVQSAKTGRLYAVGPLCFGTLFEIGAAPEIAIQAKDLALAIAGELSAQTRSATVASG